MKAVEVLMETGVPEERIIFINLVRAVPSFYPLHVLRRYTLSPHIDIRFFCASTFAFPVHRHTLFPCTLSLLCPCQHCYADPDTTPNQISSPEGLKTFCSKYPSLRVITGWIDEGLNEKAYIIPGLGDFGERRYC